MHFCGEELENLQRSCIILDWWVNNSCILLQEHLVFLFLFSLPRMERTIYLVFLTCLIFFNGCLLSVVGTDGFKGKAAKLKMIHRHSPELGENTGTSLGTPANSKERVKQLVHSDHARVRMISHKLGRRNHSGELNLGELPMRSAADLGSGQYFVSVRVGTPSKKYLLLVDTGSVLTWIFCKYKSNDWEDKLLRNERVFQPNESTSYKSIPCGSFCKNELSPFNTTCSTPQTPCQFIHSYLDGTKSEGYVGNDTIKIRLCNGEKVKLENVTIGCARSLINAPSFCKVDGIMGLGFEYQAFAVKASSNFGYKFSYCLVDHLSPTNLVNFLVFGGVSDPVPNMQQTQLILGALAHFYVVNVTGISVNDQMLDIPAHLFQIDLLEQTGGMILDSGTTLTMLVKPIYDKVVSAFLPFIGKFKRVQLDNGMEHCFFKQGFDKKVVPKFAIHFADGAKFEPPVKSYMIDVDDYSVDSTLLCLGFRALPWPEISIIGNILQQNHLWEFDLKNKKLNFAPSSCTVE